MIYYPSDREEMERIRRYVRWEEISRNEYGGIFSNGKCPFPESFSVDRALRRYGYAEFP